MKRNFILLFFVLGVSAFANAQNSNVVLFTEQGERFSAILNGLRQNDKPETNLKITNLNATFYKLKIIFDNTALGEKDFNLYLEAETERSYSIKKNNKGEYVLRLVSSVEIAYAPPHPRNQTVMVYSPLGVAQSTTVEKTTSTTTTGNPGNVSMGINISGTGMNMNVSGFDEGTTGNSSSTTVTKTTTVTTTSNSSVPVYSAPPPPPPVHPVSYLPGYNGPIGCPVPMSPGDFSGLKETINTKSFESSKLTIAKQVLDNNCLLTTQVKEIVLLFTFESTRLDFAKYAYSHTYDIGNYYKVNDAFTFESSISDLNSYIKARR